MTLKEQPSDGQQNAELVYNPASLAEFKTVQRLRQEQETFDQKKEQDARWFVLRMAMGILAMLVIPAMVVICALIISDPHQDVMVKRLAASALLVDILGLMGAVWRVILNPRSVSQLAPVTGADEVSSTLGESSNDQTANHYPTPQEPSTDADPREVSR